VDVQGKVALVTGAGTGIGRRMAVELAKAGAAVVCGGRRQSFLEATVEEIQGCGGQGMPVSVDVRDAESVREMVDAALKRFGPIDILVNNAGRHGGIGPLWEQDPVDWWTDLEVNLLGTMLCCRAVIPAMAAQGEGFILNISGGGAVDPRPFGSSYGCSKAAVLRLTDSLAEELQQAGHGSVVALAFNPGLTRTSMTEAIGDSAEAARWMPFFPRMMEEGRARQPQEVAKTAVMIIRGAGSALAGRMLHMDDAIADIISGQEALAGTDHYFLKRMP